MERRHRFWPIGGRPDTAKRARWYEEWFGRSEYELVYRHRDQARADAMVDLIQETARPDVGARILDMACGRGRHAIALARRGFLVTGIDLAASAIEEAMRRAGEAGVDVEFRVGDMRKSPCDACFDGVVNLFTSFGYFEDEVDHIQALQAMTSGLKTGGWFFQDFMNAPYVQSLLVPIDTREEGDMVIHQRRWMDNGRLNKHIRLERGEDVTEFEESVRLFTLTDFEEMYHEVGLEIETTFGEEDGRPHSDETPRLILFARKTLAK